MLPLKTEQLQAFGLDEATAANYVQHINQWLADNNAVECWGKTAHLIEPDRNFALHQFLYHHIYPDWETQPAPAWIPTQEFIQSTNLYHTLQDLNLADYRALQQWSINNRNEFWNYTIQQLGIAFKQPYSQICDLTQGVAQPDWLVDAQFNITDSCFLASPNALAIVYQDETGVKQEYTYVALNTFSNQIAHSILEHFQVGDALGIDMPMNCEAVALYLGIIKAGCVVVSIADSFAPEEIAVRLQIANAKGVFTQDTMLRGGKHLPLYEKVKQANAPTAIVLPCQHAAKTKTKLRPNDLSWQAFLVEDTHFDAKICQAQSHCNILFSSGTTGTPKAIPWTHSTAIKCGSDAYYHLNIKPNDRLAWPTNLGWMMGPWLIYASLLNRATIALYDGAPTGKAFGEFVADQQINLLGLVPSLVRSWRETACMQGLDWHAIKAFASTGECANADDMFYLMYLAHYKPVIEYCGGTEIGGAYITATMLEPQVPAMFNTPALGLDFVLVDETGHATNNGEVALIPPSIGLSNELLNKDHFKVYFADMPTSNSGKILRRHGDQIQHVKDHYYRAQGRVDDTMNLGGIKTSATEIERALDSLVEIHETAAIAVTPQQGGPSQLVVYVVPIDKQQNKEALLPKMQRALREHLNPLFKIQDLRFIAQLPRTASNKVMRRVLRDEYEGKNKG